MAKADRQMESDVFDRLNSFYEERDRGKKKRNVNEWSGDPVPDLNTILKNYSSKIGDMGSTIDDTEKKFKNLNRTLDENQRAQQKSGRQGSSGSGGNGQGPTGTSRSRFNESSSSRESYNSPSARDNQGFSYPGQGAVGRFMSSARVNTVQALASIIPGGSTLERNFDISGKIERGYQNVKQGLLNSLLREKDPKLAPKTLDSTGMRGGKKEKESEKGWMDLLMLIPFLSNLKTGIGNLLPSFATLLPNLLKFTGIVGGAMGAVMLFGEGVRKVLDKFLPVDERGKKEAEKQEKDAQNVRDGKTNLPTDIGASRSGNIQPTQGPAAAWSGKDKDTEANIKIAQENMARRNASVKKGVETVKGTATEAIQNIEGFGAQASDKLGSLSAFYESGKRGAGAVSGGKGDAGGASYGLYQMTSQFKDKMGKVKIGGRVSQFLKSMQGNAYAAEFEGLTPGSKEFSEKWKDVATKDSTGEFKKSQHEFIKATHYDKEMEKIKVDNPALYEKIQSSSALQDVIWSRSVQHGPGTNLIKNAFKGKSQEDIKNMSIKDLGNSIYDESGSRDPKTGQMKYFSGNSTNVQAGVENRLKVTEKKDFLKRVEQEKGTLNNVPSPPKFFNKGENMIGLDAEPTPPKFFNKGENMIGLDAQETPSTMPISPIVFQPQKVESDVSKAMAESIVNPSMMKSTPPIAPTAGQQGGGTNQVPSSSSERDTGINDLYLAAFKSFTSL